MKKIKTFDDIFLNIKESLNSQLPIDWVKKDSEWVGVFNTEKNEYNIVISKKDYDIWKFKYFLKKDGRLSIKLTKYDYDVFKVISTIYKSVYYFVNEINPNGLIFGADNDSATRVKFYSKFSDECSKKYNYKLYQKAFGENNINPTLYVLYRNLDTDQLFNVIKQVTDEEVF